MRRMIDPATIGGGGGEGPEFVVIDFERKNLNVDSPYAVEIPGAVEAMKDAKDNGKVIVLKNIQSFGTNLPAVIPTFDFDPTTALPKIFYLPKVPIGPQSVSQYNLYVVYEGYGPSQKAKFYLSVKE